MNAPPAPPLYLERPEQVATALRMGRVIRFSDQSVAQISEPTERELLAADVIEALVRDGQAIAAELARETADADHCREELTRARNTAQAETQRLREENETLKRQAEVNEAVWLRQATGAEALKVALERVVRLTPISEQEYIAAGPAMLMRDIRLIREVGSDALAQIDPSPGSEQQKTSEPVTLPATS